MTLFDQIARARVFDLEQPRFAGMPIHPAHKPGYFYALHRRHRDSYRPDKYGPRTGASGVLTMMEHSGTHMDALCHQACDLKFHGGVAVDDVERSDGFTALGAETMRPLLGRGVLLDVAGWKQVDAAAAELRDYRRRPRGLRPRRGGRRPAGRRLVRSHGLRRAVDRRIGVSECRRRVEVRQHLGGGRRRVVAVGADNMAWDAMQERDPQTNMMLFGHVHLLVTHGIHILENLNLEELAAAGHREFCVIGVPLKFRGATGSPIRPLALVGDHDD